MVFGADILGLYATAFLAGLASGFVPLVSTEAFLLWVAMTSPFSALLPVAVLTTFGQMLANSGLYLAGRGVLRLPLRCSTKLDALRARLESGRTGLTGVLFASACGGVPPFYLVSILAGTLRWPLPRFLVVGSCGRLLRFSVVLGTLKGLL
jgi:membrane protein YqaA with SNARE-associated domain